MDEALQRLVRRRAKGVCEYCRSPSALAYTPFEIDHIIAIKHHGRTVADNLALACYYCNNSKGPNIAGIDPESGRIVRLYHPRRDKWKRHFRWDGSLLVGLTRIGRATIDVLDINTAEAIEVRESWIEEGLFPPE